MFEFLCVLIIAVPAIVFFFRNRILNWIARQMDDRL